MPFLPKNGVPFENGLGKNNNHPFELARRDTYIVSGQIHAVLTKERRILKENQKNRVSPVRDFGAQ